MFQNKPMQLLATLVTLLAALPICAQTPVKSDDLAAQFAALDQKVKAASPAVSDQRALTTHASDKDDSKEAEKADRESDRELKQFLRHVLLQAKDRSLVEGEPTDAPVGKRGVRPSRLEEILNLPAQKISDNSSGRSNMRERFFAYGSSICELGVFLDQSRQNFAELDETGNSVLEVRILYIKCLSKSAPVGSISKAVTIWRVRKTERDLSDHAGRLTKAHITDDRNLLRVDHH